jgi:hypothetical protein
MTASRIFTYTITFFGGAAITVSAANKARASHIAQSFYGQGGTRWAAIETIERRIATGRRRRAAFPSRSPRRFVADGEAPL